MKIDSNNYEAVLLDYLEGNLSEKERADVKVFLAENPQIAAELALLSAHWNNTLLPVSDQEIFEDKESLYAIARKRPLRIYRWLPYTAAMAACLLLFLLFLKNEPTSDTSVKSPLTAQQNPSTLSIETSVPDSVRNATPPQRLGDSTASPIPRQTEPECNDSMSESQRYKSLRHINPMQPPKTYYAIVAPDLKPLPRGISSDQETPADFHREEIRAKRKAATRAFLASLHNTYIEPAKEIIEEIPENFRQIFPSRQSNTQDTVYQAFWEGEPDF